MVLIMVLDDDKDILKSVKDLLTGKGYEVLTTNNVDDCIKKLKKVTPDLILLDLMMPKSLDGKLVDMIRDIKILIFSIVKPDDIDKLILNPNLKEFLKSDNVIGHIVKPFDNEEFIETVKKSLEN
jgi:two-component system, OmpR family, response regulator VicR